MAHWLTCVLTGRHAYSPWCENGSMFLRCTNCGRRTPGWQVAGAAPRPSAADAATSPPRRGAARIVATLSVANSK